MDIAVIPLDVADDAAVERAFEIEAAAVAADLPGFPPVCHQNFVGGIRHPWPGYRSHHALAYLDGTPAGYVRTDLPQLDNTDNASVELSVHPDQRTRGVGRALHEYVVRYLRDAGRKRVVGMSVKELPGGPARSSAGAAFATAMGATSALFDVRRRLDVTAIDEPAIEGMLTAALRRASGYSLVQWAGRAPDEYVDDVAYLDGRLVADAPMGDLAWEPEKVDAARVRRAEATREARGRRAYHTGMRHDRSGRLVAWTTLDFSAGNPWHAFQQITIVEPRHRGHRLGTIVKIENLRYARAHEPELKAVDTWNAAANDHMISINEAMGFRPVDGWDNWQLTV
ncbi:MAG TPA: GNAT family N-acetyltransferase [Micromonosporaceae bacterium]